MGSKFLEGCVCSSALKMDVAGFPKTFVNLATYSKKDLRERSLLEDPGVDMRVILKWILKQQSVEVMT
jgi:hypothetical protein